MAASIAVVPHGRAAGCFRSLLAVMLAIPTYLVALPLLLLARGALWLALDVPRWLLGRVCGRGGRRRRPMRSEDAFMLMETATNRCNIVAAIELDGPPLDLPMLAGLISRTLVARPSGGQPSGAAECLVEPKWPRFQQRPVRAWGSWFWEDFRDSFDLSSHVWEESGISDEKALAGLLARLQSEAMDVSRPLWDAVLAKPGASKGGSTVLIRLHHCMGDGISLVRVLLEALSSGGSAGELPRVGHRAGGGSRLGRLLELGSHIVIAPLLALEQLLVARDSGPLKPGSLLGEKRAALGLPVKLDRVKAVARARQSSVSAVVVACFSRAMAAAGPACGQGLAKFWVPVSLAPQRGPAEMRNDLIFIMMPMAIGAQSAAAALRMADSHLRAIKTSNEAPALWLVMRAAMFLLPFPIAHPFLNFIGDKASGVFSSVPGPSEELRWGSSRVASLRFLVPQRGGVALGLSAVSYNGSIRVAVGGDAAAMPDPELLTKGWLAALQELEVEPVHSEQIRATG